MKKLTILLMILPFLFSGTLSFATPSDIGSVVALKGKSEIDRGAKKIEVKVKTPLQLADIVKTSAASRIKMLFVDDSVLTLGDNSKMAIKDFVYSKSDKGKSIFNLIDGKMRAVVGKTKFEVQTPTAVAAARGTIIYFETGIVDGKHYTKIVCLEGVVDVHGLGDFEKSITALNAGNEMTIVEGLPLPSPAPTSLKLLEQIKRDSALGLKEVQIEEPKLDEIKRILADGRRGGGTKEITASGIIDTDKMEIPNIIPIVQHQQPAGATQRHQPTDVTIGVKF